MFFQAVKQKIQKQSPCAVNGEPWPEKDAPIYELVFENQKQGCFPNPSKEGKK